MSGPDQKARRLEAREQRLAREAAAQARERQVRRRWQAGAVAALVAIIVGSLIAISQSGSPHKLKAGQPVPGAAATRALFAGIPEHGIDLGQAKAPVTLVEFADLQCPFCREYTENVMPDLVSQYVRTGKVRMVFRNLAFIGPDSQTAAQMAAAVGQQNRLWQFADLFYGNQQTENTGYVTDSFMSQVAKAAGGVNVTRALTQRSSPSVTTQLTEANSLASQYDVSATPTFLIARAGQPLRPLKYSQIDVGSFTKPIDQALKG